MVYTNQCVTCSKDYQSACGEYVGFTKVGWEERKLQLEAGLCDACFQEKFGYLPEQGNYEKSPAPTDSAASDKQIE
jgi:hypothetical protein